MMANIYGVCPQRTSPHKGYRDVVQSTGPIMSSQLYHDANMQLSYNSLIRLNSGETQELVNPLILPQTCAAVSRKTKNCDTSSLEVPTKFVAACTPGIQKGVIRCFLNNQQVTDKEKGNAANVALWDGCFSSHEENHNLAATQDNKVALGNPVTYESFVGQPSGDSLAFLRCSALSLRPQASSTQDEKLALGFSALSRSTLESISSINSCGKRIPFVADLLFTARVAIERSPNCARTPYRKFTGKKSIDVPQHLDLKCPNTTDVHWCKIAKPGSVGTLTGLLTKPLIEVTIMACSHDTQTRPAKTYLWRFIALNRTDLKSAPCRLSVEAATERDARRILAPHYILSLAARLPATVEEISIPAIVEKASMEVRYAQA